MEDIRPEGIRETETTEMIQEWDGGGQEGQEDQEDRGDQVVGSNQRPDERRAHNRPFHSK
jgi:hypothetical protein